MGFTKLFSSIITSTVWMEDNATRIMWIGMLAMANADGVVEGSIPGLANVCRVTMSEAQAAIDIFLNPDPHSRNPENDGRRMEKVDGGWRILNYGNYRQKTQDQIGSAAERMRRYREKKNETTNRNPLRSKVTRYTEAEEEAEEEEYKDKEKTLPLVRLGEFKNIHISEENLEKLQDRFGPTTTHECIEQCSAWMKSTGKKRKDHYATLLNWIKKHQKEDKYL